MNHSRRIPRTPVRADGDAALARLVGECVASGIERRALRLRLSAIEASWAKPENRRLVQHALEPLIMADRARHFELADGDVVVVWRGEAEPALQQVLRIFHALFDGLSSELPPAALAEVLALPRDAALLIRPEPDPAPTIAARADTRPPIDPTMLASIERVLAQASVARFARRRPICHALPDGRLVLAWEKRFLSIGELGAALAPGHDLQADPWLFRRLTRTLDRRMLALLAAPAELVGARPFALNLNVGSVLSPEFLRFDAALPTALRGQVHLDLPAAEIVSDLPAFVFARDFARRRGYRLAMHGVTLKLMPVLSAERLGLDFVRLRWEADAADGRSVVPERERVVLGHTDTPQALAWGRAQGLALFEGRAVAPSPG
jgi:hypothetical protein